MAPAAPTAAAAPAATVGRPVVRRAVMVPVRLGRRDTAASPAVPGAAEAGTAELRHVTIVAVRVLGALRATARSGRTVAPPAAVALVVAAIDPGGTGRSVVPRAVASVPVATGRTGAPAVGSAPPAAVGVDPRAGSGRTVVVARRVTGRRGRTVAPPVVTAAAMPRTAGRDLPSARRVHASVSV
ncbi:hypothetical protein ASG41_17155 [Modestobacter sp. Leaf380]|nr:hypothetical protein ASG41_17155 [Modestobacter sp. Leaf380]